MPETLMSLFLLGWLCQGLCRAPVHPSSVIGLLSSPYSGT